MPADRFDIVNAATGQSIMSGPLDLIMTALPGTHARIAQERRNAETAIKLARADADLRSREAAVRAEAIRLLADRADDLARRLDSFAVRQEARQRHAEAEEQRQIAEHMAEPARSRHAHRRHTASRRACCASAR
jgi:hypothetical protein